MKPKFQIGDWVKSNAHYTKYKLAATSGWVRTVIEKPVEGRIVGGCWKQSGVIRGGHVWEDAYEGRYLEVKETHFMYEVREGFTNKPKYVAENDLLHTFTLPSGKFNFVVVNEHGKRFEEDIPFRKVNVSAADRKLLSDQAKEWPRDEKGRFK